MHEEKQVAKIRAASIVVDAAFLCFIQEYDTKKIHTTIVYASVLLYSEYP